MSEETVTEKDLEVEPLEKKRKIDISVENDDNLVTINDNIGVTTECTENSTSDENIITSGNSEKEDGVSKVEKSESEFFSEQDVGITEYTGTHEGFFATIKQRYSDFIVNEIDIEGNIVRLKDMSVPAVDKENEEEKDQVETQMPDECKFISEEDWRKLEELYKSEDKSSTVNIAAPEEKCQRTNVHLSIKMNFNLLETKTIEQDGKKFIQAFYNRGRKGRGQSFPEWPKSKKEFKYVKFVLYKENKDTMDAIGLMAKNLKVKEQWFQYAGTKDRRAKTTQEITALRIHPEKLVTLNKVLWNFGVGDFRYVKEPFQLGQISGNHFTIVLRNIKVDSDFVDKALQSLQANGFINYFGMQRFGTTNIPTYKVGRALLCGEWDAAVDLILMPRNDIPAKNNFQTIWAETKDAEKTMRATPCFCNIERNLLGGLIKKLPSFNAIEKIHRNTRTMYAHSYQSFVWNTMVSRRLKELGHALVLGDLVMPSEKNKSSKEKPIPTIVTEDNITQFSLKDVVLPLPGCKVIYPENEVKSWYTKMLQEDNLDIDNLERRQKDYNMPGDYRHIMVYPTNFTWQHKKYDDYTEPLTLSDFDIVKRKAVLKENATGKLKAVVLEMSLPSSSYATMALREVMRIDTSSRHQSTLNVT